MDNETTKKFETELSDLRSEIARLHALLEDKPDTSSSGKADSNRNKRPHISDELVRCLKFAEDYAKKEPSKALGFATALGFLLGILMSRGRH